MFLFNPPAPHCVGSVGHCPCVPKYWLMETDSFTDFGDPDIGIPPSVIPSFRAIMEYKEIGFSFAGGGGFPFPIHADIHYWGVRTHTHFGQVNIEYHDHPLFGPWYLFFHPTRAEWRITRLVITLAFTLAYVDWSMIPLPSHPKPVTPSPNRDFMYFDCLGPNRFYFLNSEVISNWSAEINITPYYP
jgi:hypothetical protein